jgi:hypothetical protein
MELSKELIEAATKYVENPPDKKIVISDNLVPVIIGDTLTWIGKDER